VFPDALLNRLLVVPYLPISQEMLKLIIGINLRKVERRVADNYQVPFTYDATVPRSHRGPAAPSSSGGPRLVDAVVTNQILPEIGREMLLRLADGASDPRRAFARGRDAGFFLHIRVSRLLHPTAPSPWPSSFSQNKPADRDRDCVADGHTGPGAFSRCGKAWASRFNLDADLVSDDGRYPA